MNNPVIARISSDLGHGHGVNVRSDGLILTAAHVLPVDDVIYINVNRKTYIGKTVYRDDKKDLAFVKIDAVDLPFAKVSIDYQVDKKISAAGFNGSIIDTDDNSMYLEMVILKGDSGGGVFNSDNEVIGIVTGTFYYIVGSPKIGVALPAKEFNNLIKTMK